MAEVAAGLAALASELHPRRVLGGYPGYRQRIVVRAAACGALAIRNCVTR